MSKFIRVGRILTSFENPQQYLLAYFCLNGEENCGDLPHLCVQGPCPSINDCYHEGYCYHTEDRGKYFKLFKKNFAR
jgi:hypothetical protein